MPSVILEGPAIKDIETRRTLVKELTDSVSRAYGLPKGTIVILIKENSPENVSVGGQLIVDRLRSDPGKPD